MCDGDAESSRAEPENSTKIYRVEEKERERTNGPTCVKCTKALHPQSKVFLTVGSLGDSIPQPAL